MSTYPFTYLASPYTHPEPRVREHRFKAACLAAATLMRQGKRVFCPIAHTHPIAVRCELPRGWDYWKRYDEEMISRASKLVVVKMEGWLDSKGIAGEVRIADGLGLPVEFMEDAP